MKLFSHWGARSCGKREVFQVHISVLHPPRKKNQSVEFLNFNQRFGSELSNNFYAQFGRAINMVSGSFCGTDDNLDVSGLRMKRPPVDATSRTFRSDGIEKSLCQQRALL
jgi:hypothetical protein